MLIQNDISPVLQARIDRLLNHADSLFALGNIRERCQAAIKVFHEDKQPSPFATWGAMLRDNQEYRFALSLTLTYTSTKDEIIQLVKGCQEEYLLQEVKEERERQIEDFARMKIASRWYQMKDDDLAWRVFSQNIPYGEKDREEEIRLFFEKLDRICILTDILMGHAVEYGSNVEYEPVAESPNVVQGQIATSELLPSSHLDGIFHKALNLVKVKKAIQDIIMKGEEGKFRLSVKQTFILHKVLEEIDWLDDDTDTTFIQWFDDVYKWPWKTRDFKSVLSNFKHTHSLTWNENTVNDANTGREYRDFANYVRSQFVDIDANGKITDKKEFLKLGSDGKPMYIGHDLRRNM